jgi:hypothetical protein
MVHEGRNTILNNGDWWQGFQTMAPDGSFLARGSAWINLEGTKGRRWRQTPYFRVTADRADTMIVLPTSDEYENPATRDGWMPTFWRTAPEIVLDNNHMFWGNGDTFEIRVYDIASSGRLASPRRIIRHAQPNRPMIGAARRAYDEELIKEAKNGEDSAYFLRARDAAANSSLPAFEAFRIDEQRNLWVRHARLMTYSNELLHPAEAQTWSVFDSTGTFVGDVVTPGGLEITQIGRDWILGLWKDSEDVDYVRMYRLKPRKPAE